MATTTTVLDAPVVEEVGTPGLTVPPGFVPADTRGVILLPFESRAKSSTRPLAMTGGSASLRGQVNGPDGPVPGAVVKLERFVGDRSATMTVDTDAGGRWSVSGLLGGRYRVRAWHQPTLTTKTAQVVFLAADRGSMEVTFDLERFEGRQMTAVTDVESWSVGGSGRVKILLTDRVVSDEGLVVASPVSATPVSLQIPSNGVETSSDNPARTAADGTASWKITCRAEGRYELSALAEGARVSIPLPQCGRATTTTTTPSAPDVPDFAVGKTFKVPFAGPLPKGRYVTTNEGCKTSFEIWTEGGWSTTRTEIEGKTIVASGPIRALKAVGSSKPCEFLRVS